MEEEEKRRMRKETKKKIEMGRTEEQANNHKVKKKGKG